MSRLCCAALSAVVLLSACKVERTPSEYFDHREQAASADRQSSIDELQDRLAVFGRALANGSPERALDALAPAEGAQIVTPDEGFLLSGRDQIAEALTRFAATPAAVRMRNVEVELSPAGNTAWFRAVLDVPGTAPEGMSVRMTGVYQRREGAWELVQAHISTPDPIPLPPGSPGESAAPREGG